MASSLWLMCCVDGQLLWCWEMPWMLLLSGKDEGMKVMNTHQIRIESMWIQLWTSMCHISGEASSGISSLPQPLFLLLLLLLFPPAAVFSCPSPAVANQSLAPHYTHTHSQVCINIHSVTGGEWGSIQYYWRVFFGALREVIGASWWLFQFCLF